jgi:hypothetical protein
LQWLNRRSSIEMLFQLAAKSRSLGLDFEFMIDPRREA